MESEVGSISFGVPQGSFLGPLISIIYINDLPFALKNCKVAIYSDGISTLLLLLLLLYCYYYNIINSSSNQIQWH